MINPNYDSILRNLWQALQFWSTWFHLPSFWLADSLCIVFVAPFSISAPIGLVWKLSVGMHGIIYLMVIHFFTILYFNVMCFHVCHVVWMLLLPTLCENGEWLIGNWFCLRDFCQCWCCHIHLSLDNISLKPLHVVQFTPAKFFYIILYIHFKQNKRMKRSLVIKIKPSSQIFEFNQYLFKTEECVRHDRRSRSLSRDRIDDN